MGWAFIAAFSLCALAARVVAVRDTVVVTQFPFPEQEERARLFFQALQATNPRSSLSARYRRDVERESERPDANPFLSVDHRIYIHACVSLSNASSSSSAPLSLETARERFLPLGVEIHALHSLANRGGARDDLSWRQLTCASQVSDYFFERNALEVDVLFVDVHLLSVGDLRTTFLQQAWDVERFREQQRTLRRERPGKRESADSRPVLFPRRELPRVFCLPRAMPRGSRYESTRSHSLCELDLWLLPSSVGTDWYAAVNASLSLSAELLDAHSAFSQAALSVTSGVEFFEAAEYVVRAGRHWVQNIRTSQSAHTQQQQLAPTLRDRVSLIEFDDSEQVLSLSREQCQIKLFVKWEETLRSATVILRVLQSLSLHEDDERVNELVGCQDISFAEQFPLQRDNSPFNTSLLFFPFSLFTDRFVTPRILDVVMLNDELSLLALRMHQLRDGVVDAHVVIEAPQTFTGREKPLYFEHALPLLREMQESLRGEKKTIRRGDKPHGNMHLQVNNTHVHILKSSLPFSPLNPYVHVVLSQLHTVHIDRREQVWLNEFYSRNHGTAAALAALGARETDVLLLLDIDEIPHARTLQTLRSLYAFDRKTLRVKTLLPRSHRLSSLQFRYSFHYTRSFFRDEMLSGSAGVAVPLSIARSLRKNTIYNTELSPAQSIHKDIYLALNEDESNFVTIARTHLQAAAQPYPWRDVLWPGGWHLSFFGGSERVRNKLRSYSHQNFAEHFAEDEKTSLSSIRSNNTRKHTENGDEAKDITAVVVEDVSTQKIEEKISRGEEMDPRKTETCLSLSDEDLDEETRSLQFRFLQFEERFQSTHEKIEKNKKARNVRVAFIAGHIGAGLTLLPPLPSAHHDCFFVTNNAAFAEQARARGWRDVLITDIELVQADTGVVSLQGIESDELINDETNTTVTKDGPSTEGDDTERLIFNSVQAKWFKVFPQYFLSPLFPTTFQGKVRYLELAVKEIMGEEDARSKDGGEDERELVSLAKAVVAMNSSHSVREHYDFIVLFDNKFTLRTDEVFDALIELENERMHSSAESADLTAMMLHRRPECCGADLEFNASLHQSRYRRFRAQTESYIAEQVALGFPVHGERHFQTGFIIYNLHHDLVVPIQFTWWKHVQRVGIQCQIAFYFVAQRFPRAVQEFTKDWNDGRMFIYIKSIIESSGLSKEEILRATQSINVLVDISSGQRLSLKF